MARRRLVRRPRIRVLKRTVSGLAGPCLCPASRRILARGHQNPLYGTERHYILCGPRKRFIAQSEVPTYRRDLLHWEKRHILVSVKKRRKGMLKLVLFLCFIC